MGHVVKNIAGVETQSQGEEQIESPTRGGKFPRGQNAIRLQSRVVEGKENTGHQGHGDGAHHALEIDGIPCVNTTFSVIPRRVDKGVDHFVEGIEHGQFCLLG